MAAFLANVSTIIESIIVWLGQVIDLITANPLLLFTVGFLALGGAIGIVGRLLSRG